jgi:hypothetical protein
MINAWAGFHTVPAGSLALPYTVSGVGPRPVHAAWTTSVGAMFGDMALDEAQRLATPALRLGAVAAARALRPVVRHLDPAVMLLNRGLSTQLHDPAVVPALDAAVEMLRARHPGGTIILRSLDTVQSAPLLAWAQQRQWCCLPARRVWYQRAASTALWKRRNIHHDQALSARVLALPGAAWRPLSPADASLAASLYAQLYLEKYSPHNPHFSPEWLATALTEGWLSGELLTIAGRDVAVLAGWRCNGFMTYPVFGYDLRAPLKWGLYRLLSLKALERARHAGDVLHASAGADGFKASRGGEPVVEWIAVDTAPLAAWQRAAWRTLAAAAQTAARHLFPHATEAAS